MPTYIMSFWERLIFTAIPIVVFAGFAATVGAVIFRSYQISKRAQEAKISCVKNENAQLVHKREEQALHETLYFADFLLTDGSNTSFSLSAQAYAQLSEGDSGTLCTQNMRFLSFCPHENK